MLSFLSWGQFWTCIIITLALYYLFVAVVYYSYDIQSLLKGKARPVAKPAMGPPQPSILSTTSRIPAEPTDAYRRFDQLPSRESETQQGDEPEDLASQTNEGPSQADEAAFYEEMEDIADRLKAAMETTGVRTSRAELMDKIAKELRAFTAVVDITPFKANLTEFIQMQASELCDVELEDSDMDGIWNNAH